MIFDFMQIETIEVVPPGIVFNYSTKYVAKKDCQKTEPATSVVVPSLFFIPSSGIIK